MKLFGLIMKVDYAATIEVRMRCPLPVIDWKAHSLLLFRYNTGKRRIEWEVWKCGDEFPHLGLTRAWLLSVRLEQPCSGQ